ncbi:MAG: prolipoprotein diacylglyceryl transferase [Spirochaetales bacterium]|nr:prolipoprotein diacylglyceryl transferase [Leptospiraceae bacterium]MCP5480958.1 prolipoprotein diacylglyceryl transferase [Spirochaetales bacterium]MCP5485338.1 prolipoprotein diacylglyceryl transferase [Spirochaetales bacterium]
MISELPFQIPLPFSNSSLPISTYSIMLMIAFLVASFVAPRELQRRGLDPEVADWSLLLAVVGAIVGSKVFFVFEIWDQIWKPAESMGFWQTFKTVFFSVQGLEGQVPGARSLYNNLFTGSGLVFYGGFVFAFSMIYIYLRRRGLSIWRYGDAFMPSLALGYAIGRLGCLISGDGCYGHGASVNIPLLTMVYGPADGFCPADPALSWKYPYMCSAGVNVWNTPMMESLLSLGLFLILMLWARHQNFRPGMLVAIFLVYNGFARFMVEFLRLNDAVIPVLDPPTYETAYGLVKNLRTVPEEMGGRLPAYYFENWHWYGFTQAQLTAVALIVIGVAWMVLGRLYKKQADGEAA